MGDIDIFARKLLEEAKRFLEKAAADASDDGKQAYLHSALVLAFCSFEAHINSISDDFLVRPELNVLEQSILSEQDYKLCDGKFELSQSLKMYRLMDRVEFLLRRFTNKPVEVSRLAGVKAAQHLRNQLTHPKENPTITEAAVRQSLQAIFDMLDTLYDALYHRRYPAKNRGLKSTMDF